MCRLILAEGAMKARREIADYIKNKRTERARIRVSPVWGESVGSGVDDAIQSCSLLTQHVTLF